MNAMSIWTSSRPALALAAVLPLAACLAAGDQGQIGFRAAGGNKAEPLKRAAFFRGDVVVEGPAGYCVDSKSVRRAASSGFALLTSCAVLADDPSHSVTPAVITVSILPANPDAQQPSAAEISAGLAPVRALAEIDGDGISLVQLAQGGDAGVPGGDPRYWRASMIVNDHFVGLAAYGRVGSSVAGRDGMHLLIDMAEHMREASPSLQKRAPPEPAQSSGVPVPGQADATGTVQVKHDAAAPKKADPPGLRSIMSGLFRKQS
ncbi:hypothetical protein G5B38_14505 [Pseudohalocynthiibacter aestuariivivens]|nr:hypothetical protein [Pseudohalocynthiibacter aestuariivivens]QIE46637.1 hypothetical protein G5B38_14505 [Pseudohalocynthiibacter aestuariivivens]